MKYYRDINILYYLTKRLLYFFISLLVFLVLTRIFDNKFLIYVLYLFYTLMLIEALLHCILYKKMQSNFFTIFSNDNISVYKTKYLLKFSKDVLPTRNISSYIISQGLLMNKYKFSKIIIFTSKSITYFYVQDRYVYEIEDKLKKIILKDINNYEVNDYEK